MNANRALPLLAVLLVSCAAPQLELKRAESVKAGQHLDSPLFDWRGDGVSGEVSIKISLSEQKAHIFRDGKEVGWTYVADRKSVV